LSRHYFSKTWYVGNLGRKSKDYENGKWNPKVGNSEKGFVLPILWLWEKGDHVVVKVIKSFLSKLPKGIYLVI
jgi:hypothetical protein